MMINEMQDMYTQFWGRQETPNDLWEYSLDATQRSILFMDTLRKRGNMYFEHSKAGKPAVLVFDYETIMDARDFERPANYSLLKIIDSKNSPDESQRPIIVIDPRAGHGPGIGGSKLDSQIGVALAAGHPVYFVTFAPDPIPGQTMADVEQAEVKFLEEVIRRHPESERPAIIGNCQAGWATALIGADRPEITGPLVFNGSPLSYWGGVDGANPMRYKGGLCGGTWMTSLWSDLGNGKFDGASLVYGFEDLNPANTLWTKQYNVYANIDTEEERYLNFEKWWGGFFKMNREEIHYIVESLFVGNELEQGNLQLGNGKWVNLKNFKEPIVVFASKGDNITPPQQALNWIYKVYKTVDEIKRNGQVIVYIIHDNIGHLGIFVGSKIARKEHSAIIGSVDDIEYLSPGLYEMVITDEKTVDDMEDRKVEFVPREMQDILDLDDGLDDETAFNSVAAISQFNDKFYLTFFSPIIRSLVDENSAMLLRQMHPLRVQRSLCSDGNPFFWPYKTLAPYVKENRKPVSKDNIFLQWEHTMSDAIVKSLETYKDYRDDMLGKTFRFLYENSWMKAMFPGTQQGTMKYERRKDPHREKITQKLWTFRMQEGGFKAAALRIILLVSRTDNSIDQREFHAGKIALEKIDSLKGMKPAFIKELIREQSAMIDYNLDEAINTLPDLIPDQEERKQAFGIAQAVAMADNIMDEREQELLDRIQKVLERNYCRKR